MSHSLANAELAVMELLWDEGRVTARHIRERLYADKKNQHGTVQRLLQRLEEKGYVERNRGLPVHLFSATHQPRGLRRRPAGIAGPAADRRVAGTTGDAPRRAEADLPVGHRPPARILDEDCRTEDRRS